MPNWCSTIITINDEEEKLIEFNKKIDEWISKDYCDNGFGLNWLGNIIGNSGIDSADYDNGEQFKMSCKGELTSNEVSDSQLTIITFTAWSPMLEMWEVLCEKYLPDAEIIYTAEEPGNGIYATNDPWLMDKWIIDTFSGEYDIESNFEATDDDVIEVLQKILKSNNTNIDELLKELIDNEEIEGISIEKYDFKDISEWY